MMARQKGERKRLKWASREMKEINEIEADLSCRKLRLARVLSELSRRTGDTVSQAA